MAMAPAIEVSSLRKEYRTRWGRSIVALDGVNFEVQPGEIFGLLGPNGAGKTTAVKILLNLTHPTVGSAKLMGVSVTDPESRRKVGYLPEGHRFPGYLTARETLSIFGRMSGVDPKTLAQRIPPLLDRLRIGQWADVRVKKFSKGMTQRLGLAAALVHQPSVLLLDEPTDGVDPVGRREIRDLLKEEAEKGAAIFLNSHLLSEIELTCDRVGVLRSGKLIAYGRIDDLTRRKSKYRLSALPIDEPLLQAFRESGAGVERMNGHLVLEVRGLDHLNELIDQVRARGAVLSELTPERSTLEDVFVDLVKTGEQ